VLEEVTIGGFKSFDDLSVELRRLNLLVGPNGAGKSNFIEIFELLGQIIRQDLQLSVARAGGASVLLHAGVQRSERIVIDVRFNQNGYRISLVPTADDNLVFEHEVAEFHGRGHPRPYDEYLGAGHRESRLPVAAESVPRFTFRHMNNWVVYHFHDTSFTAPVKQKGDIGDNETLRHDASNLAALLFRLRETDETCYGRIVDAVRLVAPFFDDFRLRPDPFNADRIQLEWKQRGTDAYFNGHTLSDGTLRYICIATLMLQPSPPSLILLDEPELGLHPYAVHQVADMLRTSSQQIIVSTQSVTLLNQMDIADVLIAEQMDGHTKLERPSLDGLSAWLDSYGLGEMWEKNLLGGRPIQR
jgi:predicted ATPase